MKAVHLALTPVAGSPIRIVNALNKHTAVQARSIVLNPRKYGKRTFETDLIWSKDRDECLDVLASANVLHLHNWIDFSINDFGVDLSKTIPSRAKIFRHLHGAPLKVVPSSNLVKPLLNEEVFQLCPAQFQERFYPNARILPNIIPSNDDLYQPDYNRYADPIWNIAFSPTTFIPAFGDRWFAKAAPETQRMLKRLDRRYARLKALIIRNTPHNEAMKLKASAHLAIDEMVTGSYHINSLESLSLGLPTFAFLDERCEEVVKDITGSIQLPWINCKLEDFEKRLLEEIANPQELIRKGKFSHEWIEEYWRDAKWAKLCEHYYQTAFSSSIDGFGPRFDSSDRKTVYQIKTRFDEDWALRKKKQPYIERFRNLLSKWRSKLRAFGI